MNNYRLLPLSTDDSMPVFHMLQNIGADENEFHNEVYGMTYQQFKEWLIIQDQWARGENLPTGYVRQWTYWLYIDDKPVGYGKLRERLTERSRELGGNIGYAIASDERGKGYGTILFKELLKKAKELGLAEVMSTVEKKNPASKAVQEKCGGVLIKENDDRWYFSFDKELSRL